MSDKFDQPICIDPAKVGRTAGWTLVGTFLFFILKWLAL